MLPLILVPEQADESKQSPDKEQWKNQKLITDTREEFFFFFFKDFFGAFCAFISWTGQPKSRQETGETEGVTCSKGPQVELNLWPLQRGHSL